MAQAKEEETSAAEQLALANALRDQRLWAAAADAYRSYLVLRPEDWAARVQLGHCLKEKGDLFSALDAYEQAAREAPAAADPHLQLGHAFKLAGRIGEARRCYARALALAPDSTAAAAALSALGLSNMSDPLDTPSASQPLAPGQVVSIVFDISDLIAYVAHNRTPTGIQRVQLNVIAAALLEPIEGVCTAICAFDEETGFWREIPPALFLRLWRLSRIGGEVEATDWQELLADLRRSLRQGQDFAFAPGARLVNLGTSWWIKDYFLRLRHIVRNLGVRYIPLIYDCIPLMVPEHCQPMLVEEFAQWFSTMVVETPSALAISEWSAADASRIASQLLPDRAFPIRVVRLDADLRADLAAAAAETWPERPDLPAPGEAFVLCVGTIESRKNHLMLFQAWLTLLRRHGRAQIPRLLCVGKPGWLAEAAMTLWQNSPLLQQKVSIAHGIPDVVLAALYRSALFTVCNSHYEGWGLPVTESLSYGRIPLVARNTSLPEAGGDAAVYFDPDNLSDLVAKLESLIFDGEERARLEARLSGVVRLRRWRDIASDIMREALAETAPPPAPTLTLGRVQPLRLLGGGEPSLSKAFADMLRVGLGWYPLERWGCWSRPGLAHLLLPLPAEAEQAQLHIYLGCVMPAGLTTVRLRIRGGEEEHAPPQQPLTLPPASRFACLLSSRPKGGKVVVEIDSGDGGRALTEEGGESDRLVGLGVTEVMVCRADDVLSRLDFLERQALRVLRGS